MGISDCDALALGRLATLSLDIENMATVLQRPLVMDEATRQNIELLLQEKKRQREHLRKSLSAMQQVLDAGREEEEDRLRAASAAANADNPNGSH